MWEKVNIVPEQTYLYSIDSNTEIKKQDADTLKSYDVKTKEGRKSARAKVLELEKKGLDVSNIINTLNILDWQSWQTQKKLREISISADDAWLEDFPDFDNSPSVVTPQQQPVEQPTPVVAPIQQPVEIPQSSQQNQLNPNIPYAWRYGFNDQNNNSATPAPTVESNNAANNGNPNIYNVSPGNNSVNNVPIINSDTPTFQPQTEDETLLSEKNEALKDLISDITIDWTFRWKDLGKIRAKLEKILIKESKWKITPEDARRLTNYLIDSLWVIDRNAKNSKRELWGLFDKMLDSLEKQADGTVTTTIIDPNNQPIIISFKNETEALEKIAAMKKDAELQLQTVLQNFIEGTITHFIWNAITFPIDAVSSVFNFMSDNFSVNYYFDTFVYWIFSWLVGWATLWLEVSTIRYAWRLSANIINRVSNKFQGNLLWLETWTKLDSRQALLDRIRTLKDLYPNGSPEHTRLDWIHKKLSKYLKANTKTFDNIVDSELLTDKKFGRFFKFFKNALQLESPLFKSNTWGERGKRIINPFQRSSEEYIWEAGKKISEAELKMNENKARLSVELSELSATDKADLLQKIDDKSKFIKDNINNGTYNRNELKAFKDMLKDKNIVLLTNIRIKDKILEIRNITKYSIEIFKTNPSNANIQGYDFKKLEDSIGKHFNDIMKQIENWNYVDNIEEWFKKLLKNNSHLPQWLNEIPISSINEIEKYLLNKIENHNTLKNFVKYKNGSQSIESMNFKEIKRANVLSDVEFWLLKYLKSAKKIKGL